MITVVVLLVIDFDENYNLIGYKTVVSNMDSFMNISPYVTILEIAFIHNIDDFLYNTIGFVTE